MTRPLSTGIRYYPMDVDFFDDQKIMIVTEKFGWQGELIAIKLMCRIYREGYEMKWDELAAMTFARRFMYDPFSRDLVDQVVNCLLECGFFNKSIFDVFGVLTSRGIQRRWKVAIESSKRKALIRDEVNLLDDNETQKNEFLPRKLEGTPRKREETPSKREETPCKREETPCKREEIPINKIREDKIREDKINKIKESSNNASQVTPGFLKDCDVKKIFILFGEICGDALAKPLRITPQRRQQVRIRNSELAAEGKTFDDLFRAVRASPFLMGENGRGWRADFDWILKASNFTKILEGRYSAAADRKLSDWKQVPTDYSGEF